MRHAAQRNNPFLRRIVTDDKKRCLSIDINWIEWLQKRRQGLEFNQSFIRKDYALCLLGPEPISLRIFFHGPDLVSTSLWPNCIKSSGLFKTNHPNNAVRLAYYNARLDTTNIIQAALLNKRFRCILHLLRTLYQLIFTHVVH